ncbi:39S ribosomal protein L24, mitochondrial [Coemansia asiatica]|nr:39S ribosomal protein L24, mitochondrial [Coemansia asiatica]
MPREKTLREDLLLKKWKIRRGDKVMVISGKDRGQTGVVSEVSRKTNRVYVRGLNLVFKNVSKNKEAPSGKIQKEMPIHVSNLALVDPTTNQPTKVYIGKFVDPDTGAKQSMRYSVSTGSVIQRSLDLTYQKEWKDGAMDTDPDVVNKITFQSVPGVPPFPEDVMRELQNRYKKHY